jgi:hypothetical protein
MDSNPRRPAWEAFPGRILAQLAATDHHESTKHSRSPTGTGRAHTHSLSHGLRGAAVLAAALVVLLLFGLACASSLGPRGVAIALAVSLAILACLDPVAPFVPPTDAVPFTPPDSLYAAWWQLDETCSGLSGDWHRITWFSVPDTTIATPRGDFWGVWLAPHSITW